MAGSLRRSSTTRSCSTRPPACARKIIVFTEHRDTLEYLQPKIAARVGEPDAVVVIHGGVGREERARRHRSTSTRPDVRVMVANDAAGEGVNLQRAPT